jgi:hypothetical protein
MATIQLPPDFKEFLRLLNSKEVRYLVVGGYALGVHGYVRATGDIDIWVERSPGNATKIAAAILEFGFRGPELKESLFLEPDRVVRMGLPPIRIEVLTGISGVTFEECYAARMAVDLDGTPVGVISLADLKRNKRAAGRTKDLADLEELP